MLFRATADMVPMIGHVSESGETFARITRVFTHDRQRTVRGSTPSRRPMAPNACIISRVKSVPGGCAFINEVALSKKTHPSRNLGGITIYHKLVCVKKQN